jgi:hypothetical protein
MQQISPCTSYERRLLTSQEDVCHTAQHALLFAGYNYPNLTEVGNWVCRHPPKRAWPYFDIAKPDLGHVWLGRAYTALGVQSGYSEPPPPPSIPWRNGMKEEDLECNFEKLCPTLSNRAAGRGRLQCCLISIVLNATVDTSSGVRPC